MQQVADLGVDVWVCELDNPVDPARPDRFAYQAANYRRVVEARLSVDRCTDVLVWGLEDQETFWFPLSYDDPAPLLFDRDREPKPAYFAVREALWGRSAEQATRYAVLVHPGGSRRSLSGPRSCLVEVIERQRRHECRTDSRRQTLQSSPDGRFS